MGAGVEHMGQCGFGGKGFVVTVYGGKGSLVDSMEV